MIFFFYFQRKKNNLTQTLQQERRTRFEPPHDKTNKMFVRPAKTQTSLGIRPVWSESSLSTQWVAKDPSFLHADSEDSDQTGRMPRLLWVFAGRTCHFVGFVMRRLNFVDINYKQTVHRRFYGGNIVLRRHLSTKCKSIRNISKWSLKISSIRVKGARFHQFFRLLMLKLSIFRRFVSLYECTVEPRLGTSATRVAFGYSTIRRLGVEISWRTYNRIWNF